MANSRERGGVGRPAANAGFWALGAVLSFGLLYPQDATPVSGEWLALLALADTSLVCAAWFLARREVLPWDDLAVSCTAVVAVVFVAVSILVGVHDGRGVYLGLHVIVVGASILLVLHARRADSRTAIAWVVALLLTTLIVVMGFVALTSRPAIDVLDLHEAAAQDLRVGLNPYESIVVMNSSPYAPEGAVFEGYVYPPTTLIAYSLSYWITGDSRWIGVLAAIAVVLLLVRPWAPCSIFERTFRMGLAVVFTAFPTLPVLVWFGWTDLLAVPFIAAALGLWTKRPLLSAALLGLAFSTKEYFVLALPVLLLWDVEGKWSRLATIVAAVTVTYLPFLIDSPSVLFGQAYIVTDAGFRPDTLGLAALGLEVPRPVSLLAAFGFSALVGLGGGRVGRVFLGLAGAIAIAFLSGSQAFVNYWFLVASVVLVSLSSLSEGPSPAIQPDVIGD